MVKRNYHKKNINFRVDWLREAGYVLLLVTFFAGIGIGTISLENVPENVFQEYKTGLNNMIQAEEKTNFVDYFGENAKIILLFWLAGVSVVGLPVLVGYIGYKGFSLGYTVATLARFLGRTQASEYVFSHLFWKNTVLVFVMISLANESIKILKDFLENKDSIKINTIKYTIHSIEMGVLLSLPSLIAAIP